MQPRRTYLGLAAILACSGLPGPAVATAGEIEQAWQAASSFDASPAAAGRAHGANAVPTPPPSVHEPVAVGRKTGAVASICEIAPSVRIPDEDAPSGTPRVRLSANELRRLWNTARESCSGFGAQPAPTPLAPVLTSGAAKQELSGAVAKEGAPPGMFIRPQDVESWVVTLEIERKTGPFPWDWSHRLTFYPPDPRSGGNPGRIELAFRQGSTRRSFTFLLGLDGKLATSARGYTEQCLDPCGSFDASIKKPWVQVMLEEELAVWLRGARPSKPSWPRGVNLFEEEDGW